MWELAPGRRINALTYNGQVPGPELRLHEGERVRVVFTNALAEPTTLHWHGVDVPNAMDGVPGLTQKPVGPGETFVYEFDARPAGMRWYHTHFASVTQLDLGLHAPLIIEPAESDPCPFDRECTLGLETTGSLEAVPPCRSLQSIPCRDNLSGKDRITGLSTPCSRSLSKRELENANLTG
jgi:FtsP/CotA-like multicopper oxidase with cupredoxin domain